MVRRTYYISKRECFINIAIIITVIFIIAKVFYGSFSAGIILLPLGVPVFIQRRKAIYINRKQKVETQFKEMLISMADAMKTGYSVENAIKESYGELLPVFGYESDICAELRLMISRLKFNISAEMVIENFAQNTQLENAKLFSQIFSVAKKTGGNMTSIINSVAENIKMKESVKEEINITMSQKKLEQKIMTAIPILLVLYVSVASPGFLDVMYLTWTGRVIMTVFLSCYMIAYLWSEKITAIEI